jgi:hypothetical protein
MLRPMVATTAVTAALILLAGCGGNDKKSESSSDGGGDTSTTSPTPSAPPIASFDPPKAFAVAAAYPSMRSQGQSSAEESTVGMVGRTAVIAGTDGMTGRDIAGQNSSWTVPAKSAATTEVSEQTRPVAARVDGKDVVAIAYAETDKGNGTQKPKGLIVFQWIDPTDGKKVAEVTADLSQSLGPGAGSPELGAQAYDPETGQFAVGVSADGTSQKVGQVFTVYADPKTQKSSVLPFVNPAGVLNGTIAGAKAGNTEGAGNGTIVLADAASGKITKQFPTGMDYLNPVAGGAKHGYFYGHKFTSSRSGSTFKEDYNNTLYSVDYATGAVVPTKPASAPKDDMTFECLSDLASAVVCAGGQGDGSRELIGFDDATGKKSWGYTSQSANRVVPEVTAAFHGVVYAATESQAVLLDAKTGQDLPSATPSSSDSSSPASSDTPGSGDTPSSSDTPSSGDTSSSGDSPSSSDSPSSGDTPGSSDTPSDGTGNPGSDMSLYNGKQDSPDAVSANGAVYRQSANADANDLESILIVLKPTA